MNLKKMNLKLSVIGAFVAALSAGASQASTGYTLSILGATAEYSSASSINDLGQVSGWVGGQSVVWSGGVATALGGLGGGGSYTSAINNAGQVVGVTDVGAGEYHATVWTGGVPSDLTPAATAYNRATGINNSGVVIGAVHAGPYNQEHATRWDGNVQTDLGVLGGTSYGYSAALGINDSGVVVGQSTDGDDYRAVRWDGTAITKLGSFGGNDSIAYAVNSSGSIVGHSNDTRQNFYATLWNGNTMTKLGGDGGAAYSINDAGLVVGDSDFHHDRRAALWKDGAVIDLNSFLDPAAVDEGWELESATDINNDGWIVGVATNSKNNQQHGFLLSISAVPEPETYAMLLAGLALVGCAARRRV